MMVDDMNMNFIPVNLISVPAKLVEIMRTFIIKRYRLILYVNTSYRLLYLYIREKDVKKSKRIKNSLTSFHTKPA